MKIKTRLKTTVRPKISTRAKPKVKVKPPAMPKSKLKPKTISITKNKITKPSIKIKPIIKHSGKKLPRKKMDMIENNDENLLQQYPFEKHEKADIILVTDY